MNKEFIIIDVTGIVTFIQAASAAQAASKAREEGFKPFIIRQVA